MKMVCRQNTLIRLRKVHLLYWIYCWDTKLTWLSILLLRELKEVLGCDATAEQLVYCGQRRFQFEQIFHGKPFYDNQVSNVYVLWLDWEAEAFTLQKEEVSEVVWFDFEDCVRKVENKEIPNCILMEELRMIKRCVIE